jgi:hypothetical protein
VSLLLFFETALLAGDANDVLAAACPMYPQDPRNIRPYWCCRPATWAAVTFRKNGSAVKES